MIGWRHFLVVAVPPGAGADCSGGFLLSVASPATVAGGAAGILVIVALLRVLTAPRCDHDEKMID